MISSRRRILAGLALTPFLSGCGSLVDLPGKGPGAALYNLRNAVPVSSAKGGRVLNVQVTIAEPVADRDLDTDRIALMPTDRRIDYYADAKWSDRAPSVVQSLLLATLQNTGRLPALGRPGGMTADVALMGELDRFEAHGTSRPEVSIALNLRLITQPGGRLIRAQRFSQNAQAAGSDVESVVAAFESAMSTILAQASVFVLQALETR